MKRWMTPLTNAAMRQLKALAQHLEPVLRIGKAGLSESFVQSANEALVLHELIKVRFADFQDEREGLSRQLAERTGSILVARIGHVAVLYREHPDPARRKVLKAPRADGKRAAGPEQE